MQVSLKQKVKMCGSRNYPYPPPTEDHWGRGGSKAVISEGWGGGSWETIFQRVTDHVQNIESNVRSI